METINSLLNLPEHASSTERACAVYELLQKTDNIQAARATAESRLSALRQATSHIFAESICSARGITDASAQEDIRAAWCQDPYAAINALAVENITAANPYGCNQYGHEFKAPHGDGWRGVDRQRDIKKDKEKKEREDKQKGKNLSDALKKISSNEEDKLDTLKKKLGKSDAEIDNFEKASTDKKREILSGWKQKVRDAIARKDGTEKQEAENLFDKIRKIGKKRGWSKEKLDSTLKGLEIGLKSDYDPFFV